LSKSIKMVSVEGNALG